jgi:uracil-DNA glycosylase
MLTEIAGCPFPHDGKRVIVPEGTGSLGVLILGEAPGDTENAYGTPFVRSAPAGGVLSRAIRRAGFDRDQFVLWNVVPVQPPKNWLEGAPWEAEAIEWGRPWLDEVMRVYKPRCILVLGNVALRAVTGMCGEKRSVSHVRGYVIGSTYGCTPVVGSFHPSFLRRGAMGLFSVMMHDIKLAVAVAQGGGRFFSPVLWRDFEYKEIARGSAQEPTWPEGYVTHPSEADAWAFYDEARRAGSTLAYDIETPRSAISTEDESDELAGIEILSSQFSLRGESGIFMPWRDPFAEVARRLLALPNSKCGANNWRFDDALLASHGAPVAGVKHDVRWAWHALQPDLRGSLQFIASFYGMPWPWKHLHEAEPQAYGIADVDACMRIMG